MQEPIRAADLAPFISTLRDRQRLRPEAAAWGALAGRWKGLVKASRDTLTIYEAGTPMVRWEVEAAREIVRVSTARDGEAAASANGEPWQVAVAMFLLRDADTRRFPSERSFKVQLGRRVRHLAGENRGRWWHPGEGCFKVAYRDPSPRAAVLVGDALAVAFGVAGVYFARQDQADADAKAAERGAFYAALDEIAPAGAGP